MDPRTLDGAVLERKTAAWQGFFEGTVGVEKVEDQGGVVRFELILPTSEHDVEDYIWRSERESGTTDKVILLQGGARVAGARVAAIAREGKSERWTPAEAERYRLTFEVPKLSLAAGQPLEVHAQWPDGQSGERIDLAVAVGR